MEDNSVIYRIRVNNKWCTWYTQASGSMGCYEFIDQAKRSAAYHYVNSYEIWKFHVGLDASEYFPPEIVFTK